jgi:hypothetical protein
MIFPLSSHAALKRKEGWFPIRGTIPGSAAAPLVHFCALAEISA